MQASCKLAPESAMMFSIFGMFVKRTVETFQQLDKNRMMSFVQQALLGHWRWCGWSPSIMIYHQRCCCWWCLVFPHETSRGLLNFIVSGCMKLELKTFWANILRRVAELESFPRKCRSIFCWVHYSAHVGSKVIKAEVFLYCFTVFRSDDVCWVMMTFMRCDPSPGVFQVSKRNIWFEWTRLNMTQ